VPGAVVAVVGVVMAWRRFLVAGRRVTGRRILGLEFLAFFGKAPPG
jgi:hypothetical protein